MSGDEERASAHVLVVEDDPVLGLALRERLTNAGLRVTVVGDAIRGFLRSRITDVDLAVVDLGLPSVSGLELLEYFCGEVEIPTIVYSGAEADVRNRARELGAWKVLHKPARPEELLACITLALERTMTIP